MYGKTSKIGSILKCNNKGAEESVMVYSHYFLQEEYLENINFLTTVNLFKIVIGLSFNNFTI